MELLISYWSWVAGPFALFIFVSMYNGLVRKQNGVQSAFSSIDVMLKKRTDLIPNLVASVKQYMKHEAGLLTEITKLRSQTMDPKNTSKERFAAENNLAGALGSFKLAFENYPDLKANQTVMSLQNSLNETEEQISAARRAYNAAALVYNNSAETFPTVLFVMMFASKFKSEEAFFEIPTEERKNVNVGQMFDS